MKRVLVVVLLVLAVASGAYLMQFYSGVEGIYSDEALIASDSNSYNLSNWSQETLEGKTSGSCTFGGMDTIWSYKATEKEQLDLEFLLTATKGACKLVLISPSGELTTLAEVDRETGIQELRIIQIDVKKGLNRIKLVAEDKTILSYELHINAGKFSTLGM